MNNDGRDITVRANEDGSFRAIFDMQEIQERDQRLVVATQILSGMIANGCATPARKETAAQEALAWADLLIFEVDA